MIITNTTTIEQPEEGLMITMSQSHASGFVTLRIEDNGHNSEVTLEINTWEAIMDGLMVMIRRAR